MVVEEALALDYSPEMALAVAKVSSNFKVEYIGVDGRLGVMQLSLESAGRYGVSRQQLCQPRLNIRVGIKYLQDLEAEYGSIDASLSHYIERKSSMVSDDFVSNRSKRFTRKVMSYAWHYQGHGLIARVREGFSKRDEGLTIENGKELVGSCFSKKLNMEHSIRVGYRKKLIRDWESVYEK
ncbi:MAG: transglycosylase SLT domain-containing protein [Thiotrichales bacterium]|nr:transglycosylase SLT domain-containing protein [Thiotrichales bacterium]